MSLKGIKINSGKGKTEFIAVSRREEEYEIRIGEQRRDEYIPRECKVTIYNTILKPIIVYGCEAWSLTTKTESKLQAREMRVLRLIKGVTRRNHIRNTTIRSEMKVEPLLQTVERSRLRWYGHVMRMTHDRHAKKYLTWRPVGKRPVGRPRKRWVEGVDAALRRRETSLREVGDAELYEDRDTWRRLHKTCQLTDH